jgi:hypothetical protein
MTDRQALSVPTVRRPFGAAHVCPFARKQVRRCDGQS